MSRELEQWLLEERREGFKEGFKEEYKKGLEEGENRVVALFKRMKSDGRLQDFSDALDDKTLREKLYKEYGIE
jgi:flagellar biosynthesis/type III secretory pathway protein FliH